MNHKSKSKGTTLQLAIQALSAAEASIGLAKQLLAGSDSEPRFAVKQTQPPARSEPAQPSPRELPGIIGKFDGEKMVSEDGKSYPVPGSYAGKSKLICGDTLKMIERRNGERPIFKQIGKVERRKLEGKIAKKEDRWVAVCPEGTYRLLPSEVAFRGGQEGDRVVVLIPSENPKAPFAAIDNLSPQVAEKAAPEEEKTTPGLMEKLLEKVAPKAEKKKEVKKAGKKSEKKKEVEAAPAPPAKSEETVTDKEELR